MIVAVEHESVRVREPDDCNRLQVTSALPPADLDAALSQHGLGGIVDGEHVALNLAALQDAARSGSVAPDWPQRWTAMIDYAARKGWVDPEAGTVRAHVETG